jgi:hypothetical protein
MTRYQFNQQININLPGPNRMPALKGSMEAAEWVDNTWLVRTVGHLYVAHPKGDDPMLARLATGNGGHLKRFALAILAAEHYAQHLHTTGRTHGR